jgi:hypothetical protein
MKRRKNKRVDKTNSSTLNLSKSDGAKVPFEFIAIYTQAGRRRVKNPSTLSSVEGWPDGFNQGAHPVIP